MNLEYVTVRADLNDELQKAELAKASSGSLVQ